MILAIDQNNLVGKTDSKFGLPWHYPEDLKYYKEQTVNKTNIVGRKTFEKMGGALKQRTTVVLSRNSELNIAGVKVITDIKTYKLSKEEVMLIGGVDVFRYYFDDVEKILLTKIHKNHIGDIYYNDLDLSKFKLIDSYFGQEKCLEFQTWERV